MADCLDDTPHFGEARAERIARYWKKAAGNYDQAWACEAEEIRVLYVQVAMVWASLATELEHQPAPAQEGHAA